MRFAGSTIWITGALRDRRGAGRGVRGRGRGAGPVGARRDALDALAAGLGAESLVLPFEATDWEALAGAAQAAWGWRDGIDILVNNAGISQRSLAIDTDPDVYEKIVAVDLMAPIRLTQLLLPLMAERGQGHIVMISSVAGRLGPVLRTAYAAAKHGLIGYGDALRAEVETAYGIKVTNVLPGSVRTSVAANALQGDGSARGTSDANIEAGMDPAECARRILDGVAQGQREIIVAEGAEAFAASCASRTPNDCSMLAAEGARLAEARAQGAPPEPRQVNRALPEG